MPEIIKISHGLTIGDLKYGNARPGVVEATLRPGETMEQALDELDERLNAWHRKRYPHLYQEQSTEENFPMAHRPIGTIQVENTPADGDEALYLIKNAPSLEILSTFRLIAGSGNEVLYTAYNQRVKELTYGQG